MPQTQSKSVVRSAPCDATLFSASSLIPACRHIVDEQRLQFVLEGSDDGYWDWDIGSGKVEVNRRWRELRGLDPDREGPISVDTWAQMLHPDDRAPTMAALERHLSGAESSYRAEYRIVQTGNRQLWVSDRGKVVERDAQGKPTRLCGVNSDIDERRRVSLELDRSHRMLSAVQDLQREFIRSHDLRQQSERMLALAIETSGAGYGFIAEVLHDSQNQPYLKTHAMTNIAWDAATQALYEEHLAKGLEFRNLDTLFGYTLRTGEMLLTNDPARDPRRSGTPGGHPPMNSYIGIPIFSNAQMVGMLALANGPNGFERSLAQHLEPLLSTFAVMLQSCNVDRQRNQAILQATAAETRLRRIADGVPGAVFQCSAGGRRFRRLGFLSDGVVKLLGADARGLMQQPRRLLRLLDRPDRRALLQMVCASARSGLPWALEFRVRLPGQLPRWLRVEAQCLHLGEDEFQWNGMLFDVSQQKQVERELREAKDAADSANRAKSSFLATMSHEIRTPMNAMLGFLELLADSPLEPSQVEKIQIVRESGQSLLALIDDILDFSRVEAGRIELLLVPVDVQRLAQQTERVWGDSAARKGLRFEVHLSPQAQQVYLLDELRVSQILRNLLSNALKFTERGIVSLSIETESTSSATVTELIFRVCDTGIGVSADALQRVFRAFEQADGETTRRYGGSGLGLSISRRLAELMGGSLQMRSEIGKGTEMLLRLPAQPAQTPIAVAPGDKNLPQLPAHARLLIAEDHSVNRILLGHQLERLGLRADMAENGQDALRCWQQQRYDLLITDCHMPGMDGFELARRIRALELQRGEAARMPILACTADVLPETVAACEAAGMDDFIAKPIHLQNLATRLAAHLLPVAMVAPCTAVSGPVLIDTQALQDLTGGDAQLRTLALNLFAQALPEDIARLKDAPDDASLRRECHRLIGLARTVGAQALVSITETLHEQVRQGESAERERLQQQLVSTASATLARAREVQLA